MPRHPRIALTSRLRVHTTNDNTGRPLRDTNSAEQCCMVFGADDNLSLDCSDVRDPTRKPDTTPQRHRSLKPIHNVKQRGKPCASRSTRRPNSFSSITSVGACPAISCCQSRQSRALWQRLAALAVLATSWLRTGGAYRDRTDDLMLAKQPLSQLS
jgi:hypothetical protein